MEMLELQNRELISDINNGVIIPNGVFDAVVYSKGNHLDIDIEQLKNPENKPDEVAVFFWDYDDAKALFVRNTDISDGTIVWKYDVSIQMQMKYKKIDSVRVAVAIRIGQKYKCGFIRNKEAANEELPSSDRLIGKLHAKDKEAFITYWTESGILCLKNRNEKAFDEEFHHAHHAQLSGIKWGEKELIGYLEMPLSESIPEITMRSMTTKEACRWARTEISKEGFTGLKSVYRVSIDLSEGCKDYEDAYCLSCKLDNNNFDVKVGENVLEGEDIHTITTAEETIDVMAVREKNGLFALQLSEKIYPVMLSVVTAVYNTAPFLAEMINSVLLQETQKVDQYIIGNETNDYKNRKYKQLFEVILVDDGSTDGSAEILDDYARMSDKIRVIHKENGGVSSARNVGIEVSRGKYVTYVDHIIKTDFLEKSTDLVAEKNVRGEIKKVGRDKWLICPQKLFSIIMSVYNVELYIEDAIESLLNQSIGFEENVQLILVNDGSTDGSGDICEQFAQRFPNNIIYIEKENGGLSSARNVGLDYVEGLFVNFFDPDDILSTNVLLEIEKFFDLNYEYIDMVCIPLVYFEAQTGLHEKYELLGKKNRIVNLVKEPHNFILSSASSFYKAEVFETLRFDERMLTEEDTKVNVQVLRRTMRFGYVCEKGVQYNYRRRSNASSNVDAITSGANIEAMLAPIYIFEDLFQKDKYLAPYEKELIAYELRSRLRRVKKSAFSDADYSYLLEVFGKWIQKLDDEFIAESKWLDMVEKKVLFLNLSNRNFGDWVRRGFSDLSDRIVRVHWMNIENNKVKLICRFNNFEDNDIDLILIKRNGRKKYIFASENIDVNGPYDLYIGEFLTDITHVRIFEVPLENGEYYFSYYDKKTNNISNARRCSIYAKSRCVANIKGVGPVKNGYCVSIWNNNLLITNNKEISNNVTKTLESAINKKLPLRILASERKKYILLSDRPEKAGDNGEILFEYIMENEPEEIKDVTYFVIDKKSEDYKKIRYKDHVVDFRSKDHLEKFLNAKIIYSSHNAVNFFYPFEPNQYSWYADLLDYKFVWLQHGITKDDISKEANKINTMDDCIITASNWEFNEFRKKGYLYHCNDILLSGFARFDKLFDNKKRVITVAPTWRKNLVGKILPNGHCEEKEGFTKSEFFRCYFDLLTNPDLIEVLERQDYHLNFVLHSGFTCYESFFEAVNTDRVHLIPMNKFSYQKAFCESSLFITDFSSTAFDFAYLKKPIIYFQFDEEEFFDVHYRKGSWDYRNDGFGPVITKTKELVNQIISDLENGCEMSELYKRRVEDQFAYTDKNNCKRIMDGTKKWIM